MINKIGFVTFSVGVFLIGLFSLLGVAYAVGTPVQIFGGGTGTTTAPISQLLYGGATAYQSVATTTASCSGSASCSSFTVIGSSPITITASGGGGTGTIGTSSSETATDIPFWTTTSATPALLSGGNSGFIFNNALTRFTVTNASTTEFSNSANAFFNGAVGVATSTFKTGVYFRPNGNVSTSISVGGSLNADFSNTNAGLYLYSNNGSGDGAILSGNCANSTGNTQCFRWQSSETNQSTFNIQGGPTGLGVVKISSLLDQGTNGALLSLDSSLNSNTGQGIFLKANATGLPINVINSATSKLFQLDPNGNSTTTGYIEVNGNATSTFVKGINLTTGGCFAINNVCVGGGASGVSSITQTYGSAQTGAITFATSTDSFNGLQANQTISNSGSTFTFSNNITGTLSVAGGGTGNTTFTTGSIPYYDGSILNQDNANLYWDGTNHRLGVSSSTPNTTLSVGNGTASSTISVASYVFDGQNGRTATSSTYTFGPNQTTIPSNTLTWPTGTAAVTYTLCLQPGQQFKLDVINPNAAAGAITWANCAGTQLYWANGVTPAQTVTANSGDTWSFYADYDPPTATTTPTILIHGSQTPNMP